MCRDLGNQGERRVAGVTRRDGATSAKGAGRGQVTCSSNRVPAIASRCSSSPPQAGSTGSTTGRSLPNSGIRQVRLKQGLHVLLHAPPPPLQFSIPFECAARSSCRCCCRCCCWIQHSHGQCARAVLIHPVAPLSPRPRAIASACCGWKRRRRRRRRRRKLTRMRSGPRSGRVGITKAWSAVRSISAPTNSSTTSPQTSNWLRARSEYAQRSSPAFLLRTVSCDRKHWNGVWSVCVHKVEIAPDFSHALKLQF